ncbi:hypothetical protein EBN03_30070 [Nocardia stercoris]|uniref:Uncharacterized protein n=1 Tax=Nocardia stercoris TaxID=2483361 RepID=A0A3M2KVJ6_9NOCA|nr:hypothetical protein EBN03_30070 [Nocardia stercoris]
MSPSGDITRLTIAPRAMKEWSADRLAATIVRCQLAARANIRRQVDDVVMKSDPGFVQHWREMRGIDDSEPQPKETMSEAEVQAADDAYFEYRNRNGWSAPEPPATR